MSFMSGIYRRIKRFGLGIKVCLAHRVERKCVQLRVLMAFAGMAQL